MNNFKYTDRQVREDPELLAFAVGYAKDYEGDFDFLLEAKSYALFNDSLPIGVARGVLNCARHDLRVAATLPEPKYAIEEARVTDIRTRQPRRKQKLKQCGDGREHHEHHWYDTEQKTVTFLCEGIPYAINRTESFLATTDIRAPYCVAKSGRLLHTVDHGLFIWYPYPHKWGFYAIKLQVKLVCKYPSILRDPDLVTEEKAEELLRLGMFTKCPHCTEEE